jgi:hypothetical protein
MKNLTKYIVFSIFFFIVGDACGEILKVRGKITDIQMFNSNYTVYDPNGRGLVGFYMSELSPACGGGIRRVVISSDHPLFNSVVSAALTAKAMNKEIALWHLDTCSLRGNSWDFALFQVLNN